MSSLIERGALALTIFVVEDDPAVSDSLAVMLNAFGHRVETYPTGTSFLEASNAAQPDDVVILDLGLPDINGGDVIRALRQRNGLCPRIIVMSGQPKARIAHDLEGFPDEDVVRKPVSAKDLVSLL